jgi:hypothetical protein
MRITATLFVSRDALSRGAPALLLSAAVSIACGRNDQPAPQYPAQTPAPQPVTPPPGFGDGKSTLTPTLAASPAGAAAPAAALSQPSALALPCSTDAQCLTHRCNVAGGKCAWPCQSDNDCVPGNTCIAPTCLPKLQ